MLRHARLYSDTLVQNAFKETQEKRKRNGSTTAMFKNSGVPPWNDSTGQFSSKLCLVLDAKC